MKYSEISVRELVGLWIFKNSLGLNHLQKSTTEYMQLNFDIEKYS